MGTESSEGTARLAPGEHIFHVALASDWESAQQRGSYAVSTVGVSLEEEGFLHAARAGQVAGVLARYYTPPPGPLVLLEVDPELVGCEVCLEEAPGTGERYPHVYGPLPVTAVVEVRPCPT